MRNNLNPLDMMVSIILPVRNEELSIEKCLDSIVGQTIAKDMLEVLVIDGESTDNTVAIVGRYARKYPFIKLLENPEQNTIAGLNIGIRECHGDIIVRVDGHTVLAPDYVQQSVELLCTKDADNVGGPMRAVGITYFQSAVAYATTTPLGVGWGKFHYSDKEEYVDTVYLGAFRRELFERLGGYDPDMAYGEDNEFNLRILNDGGKILLSPQIRSLYFPRDRLSKLWAQYFKYGQFKHRVIRKHGLSISVRHLVPSLFVLGLVISFLLGMLDTRAGLVFSAIIGTYLITTLIFSLQICRKHGFKYLLILPCVFAILHLSYGFGFLKGLGDLFIGSHYAKAKPP